MAMSWPGTSFQRSSPDEGQPLPQRLAHALIAGESRALVVPVRAWRIATLVHAPRSVVGFVRRANKGPKTPT